MKQQVRIERPDVQANYGWLEVTFILLGFLSLFAAYAAGHMWRLPRSFIGLVDVTSIFSLTFPFLLAIMITGIAFRVLSLTIIGISNSSNVWTSRSYLILRSLFALACYVSFCTYHLDIGLRYTWFYVLTIPLIGICLFILDYEYKEAHRRINQLVATKKSPLVVWEDPSSTLKLVNAANILYEAFKHIRVKIVLGVLMVLIFTFGELRFETLYLTGKVTRNFEQVNGTGDRFVESEQLRFMTKTSDGHIYVLHVSWAEPGQTPYDTFCSSEIAQNRLSGRKCVLFRYVSDGRIGTLNATTYTNFAPLSILQSLGGILDDQINDYSDVNSFESNKS